MTKALSYAVCVVALTVFCGCETVKGLGRDIQNSGEVMSDVFYVQDRSLD